MRGLLRGLASVLVALGIIGAAGTGIILYYNEFNTSGDEITLEQSEEENPENQAGQNGISLDNLNINLDTGEVDLENGDSEETDLESSEGNGTLIDEEHVHEFVETEIVPPTCASVGRTRRDCECGYTDEVDIPTLPHTPGEWITTKSATDDTPGERELRCSVCWEVIATAPIPVGVEDDGHRHQYTSEITTPADCVTEGIKTYTCETCGHQFTTKMPALNHPNRRTVVTKGDCNNPGSIESQCADCGLTLSSEALTYTHRWGKWKVTEKATKEAAGKKTRTCLICGENEEKDIPKLPSDKEEDTKSSTSDGSSSSNNGTNTNSSSNSTNSNSSSSNSNSSSGNNSSSNNSSSSSNSSGDSGNTSDSDNSNKCTQHTYELDKNKSYAATCTEDGFNYYRCSKCYEPMTETIPATNQHNVSPYPTISTSGKVQYKCVACGKIITEYPVQEEVVRCRHNSNNYSLVSSKSKRPTKSSPVGYDYYECQVAGCNGHYTVTTVYGEN